MPQHHDRRPIRKNTLNRTAKLSTTYDAAERRCASVADQRERGDQRGDRADERDRHRPPLALAAAGTRRPPAPAGSCRPGSAPAAMRVVVDAVIGVRSTAEHVDMSAVHGVVGHAEDDPREQARAPRSPTSSGTHATHSTASTSRKRIAPSIARASTPMVHALEHPQEVAGREDRADAAEHHEASGTAPTMSPAGAG